MADKTGYIGRNPGDSSVTIARQTFTPTSDTTEFSFTSGYTVGLCDVYLNGVKLVDARDYDANTGSTVGLTSAAVSGDIVEIIAYKAFNLTNPISNTSGGSLVVGTTLNVNSTSTLTGVVTTGTDLYVGGDLYVLDDIVYDEVTGRNLNITGVATAATIHVGSATTIDGSGINVTGVITATSFSGDGSALTGIAATDNLNTNNIQVSGITTLGTVTTVVGSAVTFNASGGTVVGVLTATSFEGSGANLTGVAATDYIVSNSLKVLGISTFAGGDIQIDGSAAGVSSVTWDASADSLIFKDKSYAKFGDGSDLSIYHDGTTNIIDTASANLEIRHGAEKLAAFAQDGQAELWFDNSKKLETTNTGTIITGICTATSFENADGSSLGISAAKAVGLSAFLV